MELLSARSLSEVLQISVQAVRQRLEGVTGDRDRNGLIVWSSAVLPEDWQRRLELAKRIKGCDTVDELLVCRHHAAAQFEMTIDQATDYEKIMWPHRKAALMEYYRVLERTGVQGIAEREAAKEFQRVSNLPVSERNIRRWVDVVDNCGGPEHAPSEAYVLWGKRRTLDGVPQATIEYFNKLVIENQRKFAPAWKKLVRQLNDWRETGRSEFRIPGFSEPPLNAQGSNLPKRWSYKYFTDKRRRPSAKVVAGARYGLSEIKSLTPIVRKTRVGLKVGEIVIFDDQVFDEKVNVIGINSKGTRPLGLDAHDRASDCTFLSIFKPTVYDDVERAKKMLKLRDMIWMVVLYLTTVGFRMDANGTTLYVEHGTAAIPKWFEDLIKLVTNGQVKILRSSIEGKAAYDGQFDGQAHGCSNFKASLEGARNPVRNLMADTALFPAPVGKDRDHCPEDAYGRDRENTLLIKAAAKIGKPADELFRMYMLDWRDFGALAAAHIELFNRDPDHDCEGWAACNYMAQEWRLDDNAPWQSKDAFLALPPEKQAVVSAWLNANPHLTANRKLTRREVFDAGAKELVKLPLWAVPQLLTHQDAPEFFKMRKVNGDGMFLFTDEEVDPYGGEFCFLARVIDRHGHEVRLIEGDKYKTFLNPLDPSFLIVCQPNGAYLGTCKALDPAAANDLKAIGALVSMQRKLVTESRTDLQILGIERTRELTAARMHNAGVAAPGKTERKQQIEDAQEAVADEIYG